MIRLKAIWNIIRGRPVIYRFYFTKGDDVINFPLAENEHAFIAECAFSGKGDFAGVGIRLSND